MSTNNISPDATEGDLYQVARNALPEDLREAFDDMNRQIMKKIAPPVDCLDNDPPKYNFNLLPSGVEEAYAMVRDL